MDSELSQEADSPTLSFPSPIGWERVAAGRVRAATTNTGLAERGLFQFNEGVPKEAA